MIEIDCSVLNSVVLRVSANRCVVILVHALRCTFSDKVTYNQTRSTILLFMQCSAVHVIREETHKFSTTFWVPLMLASVAVLSPRDHVAVVTGGIRAPAWMISQEALFGSKSWSSEGHSTPNAQDITLYACWFCSKKLFPIILVHYFLSSSIFARKKKKDFSVSYSDLYCCNVWKLACKEAYSALCSTWSTLSLRRLLYGAFSLCLFGGFVL